MPSPCNHGSTMRGSLTRRGVRSWRLKYDLPTNGGPRQTHYITLHGTRGEAQAQANKVLTDIAGGTHVDPAKRPWPIRRAMADGLGRRQRQQQDVDPLRPAAAQSLGSRVGAVPMQKLRAADLQAIYAAMAAEGLADRTRLHLHRVTHTCQARRPVGRGRPQRRDHGRRPRVKAREVEMLTPANCRPCWKHSGAGRSIRWWRPRSAPGCGGESCWRCVGRT